MNCLHKTVYTAFTIHTVFINFTVMGCAGPHWVVLGSDRLYWLLLGCTGPYLAILLLCCTGLFWDIWAYIADGANRADGAEGADWADGAEGADRADGADRTDWADVAEMVNMALPSYEHYSILSAFDIRSSKI